MMQAYTSHQFIGDNFMTMEQLRQQLGLLGLDTSQGLESISGTNIAEAIGGAYGLIDQHGQNLATAGMFQTINPQLEKSASIGAYSPLFQQSQRESLATLLNTMRSNPMRRAFGGFEGSGQRHIAMSNIRDVFGKSMQDVGTTAFASRAQAGKSISDIINQWKTTGQSLA